MFLTPLVGSAETEGSGPVEEVSLEEVGLSDVNPVDGLGVSVTPVLSCSCSGWMGPVDTL